MIRQLTILAALSLVSIGCTEKQYSSTGDLNAEPLTIDPAIQRRDWEPTVALYANGDTVSWTTGFAYDPTADDEWQYYFADPGTYFVNLALLPYTAYVERGGVVSQGVVLPPTYTAVPPLPGSSAAPVADAPAVQEPASTGAVFVPATQPAE